MSEGHQNEMTERAAQEGNADRDEGRSHAEMEPLRQLDRLGILIGSRPCAAHNVTEKSRPGDGHESARKGQ
ncbi:unnamed protein product [Lampetra planeri]